MAIMRQELVRTWEEMREKLNQSKLLARCVCDLEHAYQIVRDLDVSRTSYV